MDSMIRNGGWQESWFVISDNYTLCSWHHQAMDFTALESIILFL